MFHIPPQSSQSSCEREPLNKTEHMKRESDDHTMLPQILGEKPETSAQQQKENYEAQVDAEVFKLLSEAEPCSNHQSFESIADFIEQRSMTYRMFRDEYAFSSGGKGNQGNKSIPKTAPAAEGKRPRAMYYVSLPSNRSMFTISEMRDLFAVFTASEGKAPTSSQILTYTKSMDKLQVENKEFLCVVKQRWSEDQWSRTAMVKDGVADFVAKWWKNRILRVRNYPETYKELSSISLSPSEHQVKLQYVRTLHSVGKPPRYFSGLSVSHASRPTQAPHNLEEMTDNETFYGQCMSNDDAPKEVSRDSLAEKLALDNQVQIVLTPSVLATLLANNPLTYEESWCIPFVVREYKIDVKKDAPGEHTRKIFYFDKKFAPQLLTPVQKNWIFAKQAIRTIYLHPNKYWEEFGHANSKIKEEITSEPEEDEELPLGRQGPVKYEIEEQTPSVRRIYQNQVYYNLWECSASNPASVLSKHHKKPFKILVRTPVRGQIPPPKKPQTYATDQPLKLYSCCTLLPKLDFQPEYGAQVTSFSEITKEWIHVMIRPNSFLYRVRVDPIQGNTIMIEPKSAVELANDCMRLHSRSIQNQLSILQNVVDAVGNLPPGNYLLNHQVRDHGFMFIYHEQKGTNPCSRSHINLKDQYSSVDTFATTAPQSSPWVPLDTAVITPTFHTLGRIPCVFAPVKNENKKKKFSEGKPPMKKKGKNKNRDKKKAAAADVAAADKASKERKRIPYHDVDAVTDE